MKKIKWLDERISFCENKVKNYYGRNLQGAQGVPPLSTPSKLMILHVVTDKL